MNNVTIVISLLLFLTILVSPLNASSRVLRLATTTSTDNSGLLDNIIPDFEEESGYRVEIISVGTGKAIRLGEEGDVDVILVHARTAEDKFVQDGFGVNRQDVMYNDFVILGPKGSTELAECKTIAEAYRMISQQRLMFISRGDDSGTHKKEKIIWESAEVVPEGDWYKEIGQGMGAVLNMANEKLAYTMSDRGTYLAMKDKINLEIVFEGDKLLFNPYGVIAVNPELNKAINNEAARKFITWLTREDTQKKIGEFKINGDQLFIPDAK